MLQGETGAAVYSKCAREVSEKNRQPRDEMLSSATNERRSWLESGHAGIDRSVGRSHLFFQVKPPAVIDVVDVSAICAAVAAVDSGGRSRAEGANNKTGPRMSVPHVRLHRKGSSIGFLASSLVNPVFEGREAR